MSGPSKLVRIRLFDGPVIEFGDGEVQQRFRSKKVGALLAYLALRLGRRCPREQISAALWPEEHDEPTLSNRLRFTLASLRKQLEPAGFGFDSVLDVSVSGSIGLREDRVWCDVVEHEKARQEGRTAEAAALLRGPLMPGYYDEWLRQDQIQFELLAEELAESPPPSIAPKTPVTPTQTVDQRLPQYLTRRFGREAELREVAAAIAGDRLVTLTGPGGIGKSRLAVEAAKDSSKPCAFVPLAELSDPTRVAESALGSLGIAFRSGTAALDQLAFILGQRPPMLLILDNAEHMVDAVADFAMDILQAAPSLHLLVTTRQRLEVVGERVIALAPLGAPDSGDEVEKALAHPSVKLFVDRARNVRPDFGQGQHAADSVVSICQKLEGFPLAIELAAVRVTTQSPRQISEDLAVSLLELKSRQRGLPERHRSLRAAMLGSYQLLDAELQKLFRKLSVFEGGWTAASAEYVAGIDSVGGLLEELVVRSMILLDPPREGELARYSFLETLRQFAADLLTDEERAESLRRHSAYFLGLAAEADEEDVRTFLPLDAEQENLIAAFANGDKTDNRFWRALAGSIEHAFVRGRHQLALRWIDEFSDSFHLVPDLSIRTRVRNAACQILPDVGRLEETQRMAADMRSDALAGEFPPGVVYADVVQGYVSEFVGNMEDALAKHRGALVAARSIDDRRLLANCLAHASGTLHDTAVLEPVGSETRTQLLHESEMLARELRDLLPPFSRRKPLAPLLLATGLVFQDRKEEALRFYQEAQRHSLDLGTSTERMFAYVFESEIYYGWGNFERAAILFGAFQALQERMGYSLERAQYVRTDWITTLDDSMRESLGSELYESLLKEGRRANPRTILGN